MRAQQLHPYMYMVCKHRLPTECVERTNPPEPFVCSESTISSTDPNNYTTLHTGHCNSNAKDYFPDLWPETVGMLFIYPVLFHYLLYCVLMFGPLPSPLTCCSPPTNLLLLLPACIYTAFCCLPPLCVHYPPTYSSCDSPGSDLSWFNIFWGDFCLLLARFWFARFTLLPVYEPDLLQ